MIEVIPVLHLGERVDIPQDLALCPYCNCELWAEIDEITEEETGVWSVSSITVECKSVPDTAAEEWDSWLNIHSYMPYVYMLPIQTKIIEWIDAQFVIFPPD